MPIEHRIDRETGIMFVRRWGHIDTHDEEDALRAKKRDPLFVPGIPVLVDCREVDPPDSKEVVQYLADNIIKIGIELDCGPIAIIVSSDVEFGMARMYMGLTYLDHPNTMVFRHYEDGLDWLLKEPGR